MALLHLQNIIAETGSEPLPDEVRKAIGQSLAPSTARNYDRVARDLRCWLDSRELTDGLLATYLMELHTVGNRLSSERSGRKCRPLAPTSIRFVVSTVRFCFRLAQVPVPVGPVTERCLAHIQKTGRDRGVGQVDGVAYRDADVVTALLAREDRQIAARDCALIAVMSDAMLRISELCSVRREDVVFEPDGSALLTIPVSKTDQYGQDAPVQFLGPPTGARLKQWLACRGEMAPRDYVFVRVWKGGRVGREALTTVSARRILKGRFAESLDTEGRRYSGHSLRVGAAQSLTRRGASVPQLQTAGRWRSGETVAHYTKSQRASRNAVAVLRYGYSS